MRPSVTLELTGDEALVLFDWLTKLEGASLPGGEADRRVLWAVEAALERVLVEPLAEDYAERVEQARQRVLS